MRASASSSGINKPYTPGYLNSDLFLPRRSSERVNHSSVCSSEMPLGGITAPNSHGNLMENRVRLSVGRFKAASCQLNRDVLQRWRF